MERRRAEKLLRAARVYLQSGRPEEALNCLYQAQTVYPTQNAEALIKAIHRGHYAFRNPFSYSGNGYDNEDLPSHTEQQSDEMAHIQQCHDYYQILGISRDCDENDIKRAYRRLALRYHPDKNNTPGAAEVFKAIANAFAVLSDPKNRQRYDECGVEVPPNKQAWHSRCHQDMEADVTPEELFDMLFSGQFPRRNVHMFSSGFSHVPPYRQRHQNERPRKVEKEEETRSQNTYSAVLQLLPVLLLVMVSVVAQMMSPSPPYSLLHKPSLGHVIGRETRNLQAPYFVSKNFEKDYQGASLQDLEKLVERDFMHLIQANCWKEKQQKLELSNLAQLYRDEWLKQKAESLQLDSCRQLSKLIGLQEGV
uniref:DnaJ homolog subfamily C member 18-like n=1 Tax=Geotrypetes seraphini TaxID=260995 RepID=A0A6P8PJ84_GEOSA|nr:dnaJ homolog subfamily C member 18-like [Geotrypetes seraphini]XP_033781545.1 dnaJ homolog subfamily C member 18-like [Geotrypetes seraphini]XP_033781548.1 dnaJ homolog subfamily C member 18-like [Geotrypetes seraphini]